jgi:outer membrane biosynthesis protein TonB
MKRTSILLLAALVCLLLASCGSNAPDIALEGTPVSQAVIAEATAEKATVAATDTIPPPPTETAVPPTPTAESSATEEAEATIEEEAEAIVEEEAPPTPTVVPTLEPNPEVLESNCLNCHSNQQLLMDLAEPEEEPEESESSGVG